jgi:hypothetical protein
MVYGRLLFGTSKDVVVVAVVVLFFFVFGLLETISLLFKSDLDVVGWPTGLII